MCWTLNNTSRTIQMVLITMLNGVQVMSNRVWFITGASKGFGFEIAKAVIAHGDKVVATARRPETLTELKVLAPDRVVTVALDVTDKSAVEAAIDTAKTAFGRIDVLVNNAGYGLQGAVEEVTDEQIRRQFETNVFGLLEVTRAALPLLRSQGSGHIINFSSVGGVVSFPSLGIYHGTKYAVEGISEALAQEVAPLGIKVTIVEPGGFRTDWNAGSMDRAEAMDAYSATVGMMRQMSAKSQGRESGDPVKLAQAMIQLVESENPPLRLVLGSDAYHVIQQKFQKQLAEMQTWETLTLSTDFPKPA
jgi:NAD(P)-dependent dehydrogenase (short-subunit alcohol dehydrogenase family)